MAMNPDVRRKAQAELDAVVGRNRSPTFGDRDELPYVEAILKETIRWHPPNPIGIAHGAMEDGYYQGLSEQPWKQYSYLLALRQTTLSRRAVL